MTKEEFVENWVVAQIMPVIALIIATGWILASAHHDPARDWPLWPLTAATVLIISLSRIHLLWLLAAGAVLGWFGLV